MSDKRTREKICNYYVRMLDIATLNQVGGIKYSLSKKEFVNAILICVKIAESKLF